MTDTNATTASPNEDVRTAAARSTELQDRVRMDRDHDEAAARRAGESDGVPLTTGGLPAGLPGTLSGPVHAPIGGDDPRVAPYRDDLERRGELDAAAAENKAVRADAARAKLNDANRTIEAAQAALDDANRQLASAHEARLAAANELTEIDQPLTITPTPAQLLAQHPEEDTTLMFFANPVNLNANGKIATFPAGIHPVPKSLVGHWYLRAHGVRPYKDGDDNSNQRDTTMPKGADANRGKDESKGAGNSDPNRPYKRSDSVRITGGDHEGDMGNVLSDPATPTEPVSVKLHDGTIVSVERKNLAHVD